MHSETAPAKVNLFLHINGRRPDGLHDLSSLICFARDAADKLTFTPSVQAEFSLSGPFASDLVGPNLVEKVRELVNTTIGPTQPMSIHLQKNIPIAAGLGGGSSDAAAVLRAYQKLFSKRITHKACFQISPKIGADVPASLHGRLVMVEGAGERLKEVAQGAELSAVIVNPLVPIVQDKTARVFRALLPDDLTPGATTVMPSHNDLANTANFIAYLSNCRNDLEPAACRVIPEANVVLEALSETHGCRLARMSGAGPSGYALFDDLQAAESAAGALRAKHPNWWIVASVLT